MPGFICSLGSLVISSYCLRQDRFEFVARNKTQTATIDTATMANTCMAQSASSNSPLHPFALHLASIPKPHPPIYLSSLLPLLEQRQNLPPASSTRSEQSPRGGYTCWPSSYSFQNPVPDTIGSVARIQHRGDGPYGVRDGRVRSVGGS